MLGLPSWTTSTPSVLCKQDVYYMYMCVSYLFFFFFLMNRTSVGKVGGQKFTSSWRIVMKNECIQTGVVKHFMYGRAVLESNLVKILHQFQNVSVILKITMEYTMYYFIYIIENLFLPSLPVNLVVIQKSLCLLWWWW